MKDGGCLVSLKGFFTEEINTMVYIVMGVSGSGKTTIGRLLAKKLALPFYDADDFHPAENVSKMKNGVPLSDKDREGWLQTLAAHVAKWATSGGAVLACSALKENYRQTLCAARPDVVQWIFLSGSREVILERLLDRKGHFMSAGLLDSQFDILEEPAYGIVVPIGGEVNDIVQKIVEKLEAL